MDTDEKGSYSISPEFWKCLNRIKRVNRVNLLKELKIKKPYHVSLQLLAVHHILTGPDIYPVEDLTLILEPIRKICYFTYYKYLQQAMNNIFNNKSLEEAYKTIHTVYGRFPEIEERLVMLYSIEVLKDRVFHNGNKGDLTEKKLNICSRVKTEIRNIGWKRKKALLKGLVDKPCYIDNISCIIETWITLVLYHELFTQHSSSDDPHLIKGLIAKLNHNHWATKKCLPYYFETCFELQTTYIGQSIPILDNMFDPNASFATEIQVELESPEKLKSNRFEVLWLIVKFWELKWNDMKREINLQIRNKLESILTSKDTRFTTGMLMKCTEKYASKGTQVYIALMTWEVLVTSGKHEQLAVVSNYLKAITHQLKPKLLRYYCIKCLPKLNPKEKVEWIHEHYDEQLPVIGVMLKSEFYKALLMNGYYLTPEEISLAGDKNIGQPTFIHILHQELRVDIELVSFIINNKAISNELLKELSCKKLRAYINLLLHWYAKENKPEIGQVLKDVVQLSIRKSRRCTDYRQVCRCNTEQTGAAALNDELDDFSFGNYQTSIWFKLLDLQIIIQYLYEKQHLPSIEDIKATWTKLLITDDITEPILDHFINLMIMACKKQDIAKLVLDIDISECKYLYKIITLISSVLQIEENVTYDKLIYKCFCIVRHHNRVHHAHDKAISEYREVFPFLKAMEANDEMEKLSTFRTIAVLLILLLLSSALGSTSSQLKKYLALKYEYKDAILYLLWCSGDVEINPGPTLKKLRKVPDSQKERSWIYGGYTLLLKVIIGCNLETKTDRLCEKAPTDWPTNEPFHNPRKKQKGGKYDDQKLMKNLFELCGKKGKSIPQHFQNEYTAWINKDKKNLSQLYTCRTESKTLSEAVQNLAQYKDDDKLKTYLQERNIHIIFPTQTLGSSKPTIHYPDIVRDLITTICRLCKGLPLTEKSDGIFNTPPKVWNKNHKYFSPCNAGKRTEKDQDKKLLNNLITYCESNKIVIPPEVAVIIRAWQTGNSKEVCKQYTIWANVCIIDHSLEYLWIEGYLDTPLVQQCLETVSIKISTEKIQEYLRKHPSKPIEQPKTAIGASSSIVQNDTETPSTSSYNKGSLNDREVNSVDSSAVKSGLISSASEDVSMVVTVPLDQSAKTQERKSVKRKKRITEDHIPAKKVVTFSLSVDKTSSNGPDQNKGSADSAYCSPTIHTDSSQDGRFSPDQEPWEKSKNKLELSYCGTVMNSLTDTKGTNIPNDTTIDDEVVDMIVDMLNTENIILPPELYENLITFDNSQNSESSHLDQQDTDLTLLDNDLPRDLEELFKTFDNSQNSESSQLDQQDSDLTPLGDDL